MSGGIANLEIFDRHVDAEWRTDWDATVASHGDDAPRHGRRDECARPTSSGTFVARDRVMGADRA